MMKRSQKLANVALIEHVLVFASYDCRKQKQAGTTITNTALLCGTLPLIRLSAHGRGLCHYFGQDYAIIPGCGGLWDYPGQDYSIIGLHTVCGISRG